MTTPAERVHASIEARTAQTTGHRDKGSTTRCPACGAPVIRALDDTVAAFTAVADPDPVDRAGELTALLTGRDTYALTTVPRLTLRRRDRWQIAGRPADTLHVVAAHACGQPLGTPTAPTSKEQHGDRIPF
jgi:hypothetical protein